MLTTNFCPFGSERMSMCVCVDVCVCVYAGRTSIKIIARQKYEQTKISPQIFENVHSFMLVLCFFVVLLFFCVSYVWFLPLFLLFHFLAHSFVLVNSAIISLGFRLPFLVVVVLLYFPQCYKVYSQMRI